jgi:hypothetical protein
MKISTITVYGMLFFPCRKEQHGLLISWGKRKLITSGNEILGLLGNDG